MSKELPRARRTPPGPYRPVHEQVERYIAGLLRRYDDPVVLEMEQLADEQSFPIVGRSVGVFLQVLARSIRASSVFEFGSGYGYSAYWFARALVDGGTVLCTDGDAGNAELARKFLGRAGLSGRVDFRTGWAQEIFQNTAEPRQFDIIYNDVDKCDYPEVWLLARERVRPGGFYIADNCLWGGRVAADGAVEDVVPGFTEGVRRHNQLIAEDQEFDVLINPIRDGVIVACRR